MRTSNTIEMMITAVAMLGFAAACGGNQEEAESPSAPAAEPPAAEPAPASDDSSGTGTGTSGEAPAAGEHTMPDGTKMEGHHHDENKQE